MINILINIGFIAYTLFLVIETKNRIKENNFWSAICGVIMIITGIVLAVGLILKYN